MANSPSVCVRVSQSCRLVNVLKNGWTSSITKASSPTIMQVAFSSVNRGSNAKPSLVKKSTERFRSRTGRLRNILRGEGVDTAYLLRWFCSIDRPQGPDSSVALARRHRPDPEGSHDEIR